MYRKTLQRPVACLPITTSFQEYIAVDLKLYEGNILLHISDNATILSVSSFVKSKQPEAALNAIFKSWIQIYGATEKLLTKRQRIVNSKFIDITESMNTAAKVTATESPFSNKLVQRHNLMIVDVMDKVFEESQLLEMDLTLTWCLNAKKCTSKPTLFFIVSTCICTKPQTTINLCQETTITHFT